MVAERLPTTESTAAEGTHLALIPQPAALPLLSPDERDQVLEVAQMVAEEADRLQQLALVIRIRAAAHRAVKQLGDLRQKASLLSTPMWQVESAATCAKQDAGEAEQLMKSYDALVRRIAKRRGQQESRKEQGR